MAVNSFTAQINTVKKHNIGAGLTLATITASFNGTQSTLSIASPLRDVSYAKMEFITTNIVTGTTPDVPLLTNSANSSGLINLIANSTNNSDVLAPDRLVFSRNGTNPQDCTVLIIGKA